MAKPACIINTKNAVIITQTVSMATALLFAVGSPAKAKPTVPPNKTTINKPIFPNLQNISTPPFFVC